MVVLLLIGTHGNLFFLAGGLLNLVMCHVLQVIHMAGPLVAPAPFRFRLDMCVVRAFRAIVSLEIHWFKYLVRVPPNTYWEVEQVDTRAVSCVVACSP